MRNILDGLGEHPATLAAAGAFGSAVCGAGLQEAWGTSSSILWLVGIAVFVALPAVSTRLNRLQQGTKAARNCIKQALAACGSAYGYPAQHCRTNIMLVVDGKRRVDSQTAFNMSADPDVELEIDATAGVSGEAYVHRVASYGDLELALQPGGPTWGLRETERARVRPTLKSILSVPIFDPDDPDGAALGTLQVDSDSRLEVIGFDNPERRAIAERFADVVALLLKAGR